MVDAGNSVLVEHRRHVRPLPQAQTSMFDQTGTMANPHLWYPNNSTYGTPYMYKVYHIVKWAEPRSTFLRARWESAPSPGTRISLISMDTSIICTALRPATIIRRSAPHCRSKSNIVTLQILTKFGGRLWRPGHSACSPGFVHACDDEGVMLMQPSGDGEGLWSTNVTADQSTSNRRSSATECIRDRNDPSILAWEVCNGNIVAASATRSGPSAIHGTRLRRA